MKKLILYLIFALIGIASVNAQKSTKVKGLPAVLRAESHSDSEEITTIPQHQEVTVLDYENTYFKVKYKNKEGWVRHTMLELTDNMKKKLVYNPETEIKGIDFNKTKFVTKGSDYRYGELLYDLQKNVYLFVFDPTPVGLKNCITKVKELLTINGLNFNNPDKKDELIAEYVDDFTEYSSLSTSIKSGKSQVRRVWRLNGSGIGLTLAKDVFMIILHTDY